MPTLAECGRHWLYGLNIRRLGHSRNSKCATKQKTIQEINMKQKTFGKARTHTISVPLSKCKHGSCSSTVLCHWHETSWRNVYYALILDVRMVSVRRWLFFVSPRRGVRGEIEKWRREAPGGSGWYENLRHASKFTKWQRVKRDNRCSNYNRQHANQIFNIYLPDFGWTATVVYSECVCVYLVWMFVKVNRFVHRKIWNSKDKTFPIFDKNSVGTRADKQQCDLMTVSGFESHSLSLSLSFCSFFRLNFSAYSIYLNFIWFGRWM